MKKLLNAIFLMIMSFAATAQDCSTAHDCYNMGHQYGYTQEAVTYYEKALSLWNGTSERIETKYWILAALGNVYFQMKEYPKAIQHYNQIIQLKPEDPVELAEAFMSRGNVMLASENYNGAIASYNKAIEISPPNLGALSNKALAYHKMGDKENSLSTLKACADLGSLAAAADIYVRHDNLDYREEMNAALARDADWQQIEQMIDQADQLAKQKQYQPAMDLYEKIEMRYEKRGDSENIVPIMVSQANVERQRKNYQKAVEHASRAVYSSYATKNAYLELGYAKYYAGDQVGAVEVCNEGINKFSNNTSIRKALSWMYFNSANTYYNQKDYKNAYSLYYSAYDVDNSNVDAIKFAGHSAYNAQYNKEALNCYNMAVRANPNLQGELKQYLDYLNSVVR